MNHRSPVWLCAIAALATSSLAVGQDRPPAHADALARSDWFAEVSALLGVTGPAWTADGDQVDANFGIAVAPAGDVNGDGFSDVIVGASQYDNGQTNEGRAYVYLGSAAGLSTIASWSAESDQAQAFFGAAVATAGDVNGDGYSDVVVGAYLYDNGQSNEGRAFVYLGSSTGLSATAAWTSEGDQNTAWFAFSVATAGDVNADGYSDVIIGAPLFDDGESNEGRACVYLGSSSGLASTAAWIAHGDQDGAQFGTSVAAAGDVDGDGRGDAIVGANEYDGGQSDEGRAYVFLGTSTGLASSAHWIAEGDQTNAKFGSSVATAGDVNRDGFSDVIVGSHAYDNGETDEGRAFVYLGSAAGLASRASWTAEGDQDSAFFAVSVATAGDVNGDGYSDVIVGAWQHDSGQSDEGRTSVYLGSSDGLSPTADWTGESDRDGAQAGFSVATAGDVNGDGYSDWIVGAFTYSDDQANEGRAFVYLGSASALAAASAWTAECDQAGAAFGRSATTAGDVNGDGFSDVVVGAPDYANFPGNTGRAFVYAGSAHGLSASAAWSVAAENQSRQFGASVASAGDVNGDGYSDVIVGAPYYFGGQAFEGAAFVYLGSATGLQPNAAWSAESDSNGAQYGSTVSTAGDVNGDGYGDVIVGAYSCSNGQTNEGRAYVYLGSSSGLASTAAWTAESNQANSFYGYSVSTAGDVDGDGFSDIIVGAYRYEHGQFGEGAAFVYRGSSLGIVPVAHRVLEHNHSNASFGIAVATAGDVNGDGYSDVLVAELQHSFSTATHGKAYLYLGSGTGLSAIPAWDVSTHVQVISGHALGTAGDVNGDGFGDVILNTAAHHQPSGPTKRGAALYLGSSTGLAATADWSVESPLEDPVLGAATATAGDVNGDGFSDVIIGAADGDAAVHGQAYVYLGNEGRGGWTRAPQQRRSNDTAPIDLLGRSMDKHVFRIRLGFERELAGFAWASGAVPKARLEWELRPLHESLDGSEIESGAEQTITGSPLTFNELVEFERTGVVTLPLWLAHQVPAGAYHWRARMRTNNPLFPVTPWTTIPWNNVTETKLRTGPLPAFRSLR